MKDKQKPKALPSSTICSITYALQVYRQHPDHNRSTLLFVSLTQNRHENTTISSLSAGGVFFFTVNHRGGLLAEGNEPEGRRFSRLWNQNKQRPTPATQQPTAADRGYLCGHTWTIPLQWAPNSCNGLYNSRHTKAQTHIFIVHCTPSCVELTFGFCTWKCKL